MIRFFRIWLAIIGSSISPAMAYDIVNHSDMTDAAVSNSALFTDSNLLRRLGLLTLPADSKFPSSPPPESYPVVPLFDFGQLNAVGCTFGRAYGIRDLVRCGAAFEDVRPTRVLNHWFDPTNNRPLTICNQLPGNLLVPQQPNLTSPDWALQDNANILDSRQQFSYKQAREYYFNALTTTGTQSLRDTNWGLTFESVGHVLHHLEDMAQPQHVRNDAHLIFSAPFPCNNSGESLYEALSGKGLKRYVDGSIASADELGSTYTTLTASKFRVPRDFWKNPNQAGLGMAEFTNTNFVSFGTNFKLLNGNPVVPTNGYARPQPLSKDPVSVTALDPPVSADIKFYCDSQPANCTMTFFSTNGDLATPNPRASVASIFDQYVNGRQVVQSDPAGPAYYIDQIPTVNQYTFISGYPLLVPRAVSFAAGLIDYFFRGSLDISAPPEGVYALADHGLAAVNTKNSGGFTKIKARVRNATPGLMLPSGSSAGEQLMEPINGKLYAVVKFHRNDCYKADLSGEYRSSNGSAFPPDDCNVAPCPPTVQIGTNGVSNVGWPLNECPGVGANFQTPLEEIVISDPIDVTSAINDTDIAGGQIATFTFQSRVPINARDMLLQVVYKGRLGDEPEAVSVGAKEISEPSYIVIGNMTDYLLCINGAYFRNAPDGSLSSAEQAAITALGGDASDFANPQYLKQVHDKVVVATMPPYNFNGLDPPFPTLNPLMVDSNLNVIASKDNLAPGQFLRLAFLTEHTSNGLSVTPNNFEIAAADQSTPTNDHWYNWTVSPVWYNVNKRGGSEGINIATANTAFRDFRASSWYMTYKTYFVNQNCFGVSQLSVSHDNPPPSELVPFTTMSF